MNKLTTKKILGYRDATQTFVINAKQSDTNRQFEVQIVDELTLVDFTNVTTAILYFDNNSIDITYAMNKDTSSFLISLNEEILSSIGDVCCEIVLKDSNDEIILTTNTFVIKIKGLKGWCNC